MTVIVEIWKQRNHIIFNNATFNPIEIFILAQLKAWSWLSSKEKYALLSY